MGAHLVAQALASWTHVSDRAFRVLVRMSLTALDNPKPGQPAGIYHGGRDLLAMSLRSDKGTPATRYTAVKRAVAELTAAGAIEHLKTGWAGQNAVYRLTLHRSGAAAVDLPEDDSMGGQFSPPEGGFSGPPMGGQNSPERGVSETPPRNQEEVLTEREEENVVDLQTASHPPRVASSHQTAPVIALFPGTANAPTELPYRSRVGSLRWSSPSADTVAEASARVAQRRAEHQARLASGETT